MFVTRYGIRALAASATALVLVGVGSGAAGLAHATPGQVDPDLLAADFEAFVLSPQDLRKVPGLKQAGPFESDGPSTFDPGVPSPCTAGLEGTVATYTRAARDFSQGETGDVLSTLGAVPDAEEVLGELEQVTEECTSPYESGETTYEPLDRQPKLKTVGDGVVAFAAVASRTTERTFYWIWVRRGPALLSSALVIVDDPLGDAALNRLAKRMNKKAAALERSVG
ncbi:MAG: hypothetical protein ACRDY6_16265 [Acidimicrobiia bacterium]